MSSNTEAALLDAMQSVFGPKTDDINPIIEQYALRQGVPYLSPAHIMSVQKPQFGVAYWMQGIAMQTCNNQYIQAPEPPARSKITHNATTLYTKGQYGVGAAPTGGIFTGVEDKC